MPHCPCYRFSLQDYTNSFVHMNLIWLNPFKQAILVNTWSCLNLSSWRVQNIHKVRRINKFLTLVEQVNATNAWNSRYEYLSRSCDLFSKISSTPLDHAVIWSSEFVCLFVFNEWRHAGPTMEEVASFAINLCYQLGFNIRGTKIAQFGLWFINQLHIW